MSSTHYSNIENNSGHCFNRKSEKCHGHWSAANIGAMVLGFIIFAPIGVAILVWSILGRPVQELPGWLRQQWRSLFGGSTSKVTKTNDNSVFNEYQQTQYDRINEIKEEIRNRAEAFRHYRENLKQRQDQQEFDDFMSSKPASKS